MASPCLEAVSKAGRVAPVWLRAAWAEPLGVYSPEQRHEQNALRGFINSLADMLARVCGAVLHRGLLSQKLAAVIIEPWRVEERGEECRAARSFRLLLDTGLSIDVFVAVLVGLDGGLRGLAVESKTLGCTGVWGRV